MFCAIQALIVECMLDPVLDDQIEESRGAARDGLQPRLCRAVPWAIISLSQLGMFL